MTIKLLTYLTYLFDFFDDHIYDIACIFFNGRKLLKWFAHLKYDSICINLTRYEDESFYCRQRRRLIEYARYWKWIKKMNDLWKNTSVWLPIYSNGYDEQCRGSRIDRPIIRSPAVRRSWRSTGRIGANTNHRASNKKLNWKRISILCRQS